ncbi:LPS export ABC transporter periplasmic protein LptC [Henriciella aquimarina]|uniref:LPS export ABC transporter periplasmic protein LptC n=1 Tax=Henriciella aquimarina TaxID=545261 RepID=UPI000A07808D|nr:LPS export ABC transporter periplasmic protein LptC [Henriciella aquimarina]
MEVSAETERTLSVWEPRRQMTLEQARQRSAMVSFMRLAFTAGAAIAVGIMVGHLTANAISASPSAVEKLSADQVVTMVNPRFTGRDLAGRSFVITADTAQRQRGGGDGIDLRSPKLVSEDGTVVTAPSGLYNQDAQTLELYEDVQVTTERGYTFASRSAKMFINEGRVEGIDPLSGSGPLGDVRSNTYEIVEEGDKIVLSGGVEMTIVPEEKTEEESEAAPADGDEERGGNE